MVPPLWMNSLPVPSIFWRMKPSPPKKPAPMRFVKAMLRSMSPTAQRKASFWQSTWLALSSIWMILPGYGPANATRPAAGRPEIGDEEALSRQELALEAAEEPAVHLGVHLDLVGHEHHRARFGADLVARRQAEDDRLHVVADDLVCHHFSHSADGFEVGLGRLALLLLTSVF